VDEHRREADAEVVSAVPLTDTQREAVVQRLKVTNNLQSCVLTTRVDPDILGGLVIRVGDKLIDGSVVAQLSSMREQLKRVKIA
jgi:ATP synthase F1 delta subunit